MAKAKEAQRLLELSAAYGMEDDYLFQTTFQRYEQLLKIMGKLQVVIDQEGALTTKEYVKGRQNIYAHPAIGEYVKTSAAANQTVSALIRILTSARSSPASNEADELLQRFVYDRQLEGAN